MPFNSKDTKGLERTDKFIIPVNGEVESDEGPSSGDRFLEAGDSMIEAIGSARPYLVASKSNATEINNYKILLEIAAAVNNSLVTD